jgi:hypothetical protein
MHDTHRTLPALLLIPLLLPSGEILPRTDEGAVTPPAGVPTLQDVQDEKEDDEELTPLERARRRSRQHETADREPLLDSRGVTIVPGVLPEDASEAARKEWQTLLAGILSKKPIESFHLGFYLLQRDPNSPQTNDLDLDFSFLTPRYLRAMLESGRMHLRGPDGDFLITDDEVMLIPAGREGVEDRKQIDEMAAIARNFIGLTDPRTLRLISLETLEKAPAELPAPFLEDATKLRWLAIKSPDFYLYRSAKGREAPKRPIYLARLGIDTEKGEIRLALIHEEREGKAAIETAVLVNLRNHQRRSGFLVPHKIDIYDIAPSISPWRFQSRPTSELTLRRHFGHLRANLTPEDFKPTH